MARCLIAELPWRFAARTAAGPPRDRPALITQTCPGSSPTKSVDGSRLPVYSQRMTTDGARLAAIEAQLASLDARLEAHHRDMLERIDGGSSTPWERSVRGRLHSLESESASSKAAASALAEAQRERRKATEERKGDTRAVWRLRMQIAAVAVAAVAVAAPYLHHL